MNNQFIPPATVEKLATPVPKGQRHQAAIEIALPMIGNGVPEAGVFATLRSKFEPDVTDSELHNIVRWCVQQHPTPSVPSQKYLPVSHKPVLEAPKPRSPLEHADWWTNAASLTPDDMAAQSPVSIPSARHEYAALVIGSLYRDTDYLNVVCKFTVGGTKTRPQGGGKTLRRDEWLAYFSQHNVPSSDAGAWFRLNPCNPVGSGADGSITDADITNYRFILVESDVLPINKQLALLKRWKLPISAVVLSGADSAHAWVKVQAGCEQEYSELAKRLFDTLKPFGVDQANKNPSRLCRLPGAIRKIGAAGNGEQRLLWLNPDVEPLTMERLRQFEETLEFTHVEAKPLAPIARRAVARYEWMHANRGKLGVPTGIDALDKISGGLKKGQTVVIGGATGGGKTTLALHMICTALNAGYGVVLFSLEMGQDEIFDLLMANYARVDRNAFNHGDFSTQDFQRMSAYLPKLSGLPLFIEDSAVIGVDQIRNRIFQLKADNRIQLAVVDYIQFVNTGLTKESREQQVAQISHALRTVAREADLPMIVLSQLNDEGQLRESRVIAHNANIVLRVDVEGDSFTVRVRKGRGIPLDDYPMFFDRKYARLVNSKIDITDYDSTRTTTS